MGVRVGGAATITTHEGFAIESAQKHRYQLLVAVRVALSDKGFEQNWLRTERNKKALSRL